MSTTARWRRWGAVYFLNLVVLEMEVNRVPPAIAVVPQDPALCLDASRIAHRNSIRTPWIEELVIGLPGPVPSDEFEDPCAHEVRFGNRIMRTQWRARCDGDIPGNRVSLDDELHEPRRPRGVHLFEATSVRVDPDVFQTELGAIGIE